MDMQPEAQHCDSLRGERLVLMASGLLYPGGAAVTVQRGMIVAGPEGSEMGRVAAVALRPREERAECLILSRLPDFPGYRSIPVSWVVRVEGQVVYLNADAARVLGLPEWHAE